MIMAQVVSLGSRHIPQVFTNVEHPEALQCLLGSKGAYKRTLVEKLRDLVATSFRL